MQAIVPASLGDLREGYADLAEVRLHYVEAGTGPLVVLLHGFPEAWFSWRFQILPLAAAGHRVLAPDLRGYNLSSRPRGVAAYDVHRVVSDVRDLIVALDTGPVGLVGHDWGGVIGWVTAMEHAALVERLVVLNAPHPRQLLGGLTSPRQLARSWYIAVLQLPWLPERLLRASHWAALRHGFAHDARPHVFTPSAAEQYTEAWSQPGAATAMIDYYRAAARRLLRRPVIDIRPLQAPTLVIWGERDRYLARSLAVPRPSDVPNLARVVRRPDASHWVHQDEPAEVNRLLIEFFARHAQI
jgi:pimeloyl-ACP methyl ester carboxylesterase